MFDTRSWLRSTPSTFPRGRRPAPPIPISRRCSVALLNAKVIQTFYSIGATLEIILEEFSSGTSREMGFYSIIRIRTIISSPALCFLAGFSGLAECLPRGTGSLHHGFRISLFGPRGHSEPLNTSREENSQGMSHDSTFWFKEGNSESGNTYQSALHVGTDNSQTIHVAGIDPSET